MAKGQTISYRPSATLLMRIWHCWKPTRSGFVSERAEARLRAALERLTGGTDTPPTVLEALVLEALDPLLRDWLERNLAPLVERLVEAEIAGHGGGDRAKQLEADDALV